jgi:hypothetical protein
VGGRRRAKNGKTRCIRVTWKGFLHHGLGLRGRGWFDGGVLGGGALHSSFKNRGARGTLATGTLEEGFRRCGLAVRGPSNRCSQSQHRRDL